MNTIGRYFRVTTWGESHGPALGAVVDGCPSRLQLTVEDIQKELDLRKPGSSDLTSPRKEPDTVEILSGVFEGQTTGAPISLLIRNRDVRSRDYTELKDLFRPGHADFTYQAKYGHCDYRGSGRASGRETAARVAAGAIAQKLLGRRGIRALSFIRQIGSIALLADRAESFFKGDRKELQSLREKIYASAVRCPDPETATRMAELVRSTSERGDSVGGVVEVRALGLPAGLGDPVFDKLDALIAGAVLSVGAVKGIEFGVGFRFAELPGSVAHDVYEARDGLVRPATNRAGGVLGGISTGEPLVFRAVVKATSSIRHSRNSVDRLGNPVEVSVTGRHDPCIALRVVPVLEHMVNLVLIDLLLSQSASKGVNNG